jgi:hypothetical protein
MFQSPGWYAGASAAWHGGHARFGRPRPGPRERKRLKRLRLPLDFRDGPAPRGRDLRFRMHLRGAFDLRPDVLQHFGLQDFLRGGGAQQPALEVARLVDHVDVVHAAVDHAFVHV